jgi:diguanylate cyclase (GGDEF)-like protein
VRRTDPPRESPLAASRGEDLVASLEAFRALHRITKRVHASLDLGTTLDAVAQGIVDVAAFGVAVVNLAVNDGFEVVSVAGNEQARESLLGLRESREQWQRMLKYSQRLGNLRFVDHRTQVPLSDDVYAWVPTYVPSEDEDAWHPLDALFAPLTSPTGDWIGVLSVDLPASGRRPDPVQLEVLELFADQAAIAIDHARMHSALQAREAEARYSATHDWLTGLANRGLLMTAAERLAREPDGEVAVLMVDLDDFKRVNDTAGHRAGDEVLKAVAGRLRASVRESDVVARTGGDEFVVVMAGPGVGGPARLLVDRLGRALSEPVRAMGGSHRVGVSIGLAVASTPTAFSEVLSQADASMYQCKRRRGTEPSLNAEHSVGTGD